MYTCINNMRGCMDKLVKKNLSEILSLISNDLKNVQVNNRY